MSISLSITWPNTGTEHFPLVGQSTASQLWQEVGNELGLRWVPILSNWVPIDHDNLDELLHEILIFRDALERKQPSPTGSLEAADRLIEQLRKLQQSTGWEASIG